MISLFGLHAISILFPVRNNKKLQDLCTLSSTGPRNKIFGLEAPPFKCNNFRNMQGGRSWQPFGKSKNGHKTFVRRVFAIFATKAWIVKLQIYFGIICNIYHVIESLFLKSSKKCVNRDKSWYRKEIAYVKVQDFRPSPNFSAKALRAFAQHLPPCFETKCIDWYHLSI